MSAQCTDGNHKFHRSHTITIGTQGDPQYVFICEECSLKLVQISATYIPRIVPNIEKENSND